MDAVLADFETAPIGVAEKALFRFLERVNHDSHRIRREHLAELQAAGWSDEAIYDAITVCALFNFYNRWVDATGVGDMPASAYELAGKRMAEHGYAPDETGA